MSQCLLPTHCGHSAKEPEYCKHEGAFDTDILMPRIDCARQPLVHRALQQEI